MNHLWIIGFLLISPGEAVKEAQQKVHGRVISVDRIDGDSPYYVVRIEFKGHIENIRIDARKK